MKAVGIIAELNPFHRGHKYLLDKVREDFSPDLLVVLTSGNFVQRGEPAIFDMGRRSEAALKNGADMVLELPPCFSTASAEGFALGAVKILNDLGCTDLVFGSETGDIEILIPVAEALSKEDEPYKKVLKAGLQQGLSFPAAREAAVLSLLSEKRGEDPLILHNILQNPNDILGIEYLKALKILGSSMNAGVVKRAVSSYHEDASGGNALYSAEAIRNLIFNGESLSELNDDPATSYIPEALKSHGAVNRDDLTDALLLALISKDLPERLKNAAVPEELSNRIHNSREYTGTFSGYIELLKRKNITYTAVSRHLLHLALDITPFDPSAINYVRLLGFRENAVSAFGKLQKNSGLPVLSNSSDINNFLESGHDTELLLSHLRIDRSYELLRDKEKRREHPLPPEISRRIIKV